MNNFNIKKEKLTLIINIDPIDIAIDIDHCH